MRTSLVPLGCLLFSLLCLPLCLADASIVQAVWNAVTHRNVTSYQSVRRGRSVVACLIQCRHTEGCASAAFNATAEECYLQLQYEPGDPLHPAPTTVWAMASVWGCIFSHAPVIEHGHIGTWRTMTSRVEGDVTCDDDYMYDDDDTPLLTCPADGVWTLAMNGQCKQYIWRSGITLDTYYNVPRAVDTGWSMCFEGTLTSSSGNFQARIGEAADTSVTTLKIWPKADEQSTWLTFNNPAGWGSPAPVNALTAPSPPFPFVLGQRFALKATAVTDLQWNVFVDGNFYGDYTTQFNVTDVARVKFIIDVQVHFLNVWC